ncbi:TonB-linked outer membrane protein, SusC/RagA family [Draconibacterium orientale]|uniref:TonB-dependent receptor n=1 Tax=Draconibacterium orientale TaxID=1168034 RepID=X5DHP8_9BACT|nr:SusC/RagA family TonB-linked outer membrane protein [Draconibacterium orientale]AHW60614.1 TonB-dependent receptor [Draconibacterium orientale]SET05348.1 TonB-linked outer membrane protein, SusC/RagA family [Draconibacterium orientale]
MKNKHIKQFLLLSLLCSALFINAQETNLEVESDSIITLENEPQVDMGLGTEDLWRYTGASFSISGEELARELTGNLLKTLQGRIPGLTVLFNSGEPGYDNPALYGRGMTSWNSGGNDILIYLDGFRVDVELIASLSVDEIKTVTYAKDAAALSAYGMEGANGVLSIRTKRGEVQTSTKIIANARYGVLSVIDLPTVMNAFDYTTMYNQARENDGLTPRYANPDLYKNGGDVAHPDVDWYDEVLKSNSTIQNMNLSFTGGGETAKFYVLLDYKGFSGYYKDADTEGEEFGTNAQNNKFNIRGNVDLNITKSLAIKAEVVGSIDDKDTPAGFSAGSLFDNLMGIPAAAFSVKNPNGTWGNSSVYNFNPVERLRTNGIWNSHTRGLQTNFSFDQKLDVVTEGLSLTGALSFSNQYIGYTGKSFSGLSYEMLKDDNDDPILDNDGNYTYKELGSISDDITDGLTNLWNRQVLQLGLNYKRDFDKHSFVASLLARRQNYSYFMLTFPIRNQGLAFNGSYAFDKKYIASVAVGYNGSADFEDGERYGVFPSLGLGWIVSNEDFLANNDKVNFLKLRGSYGITGSTNNDYRFLFEQKAQNGGGWRLTSDNTWYTGRREGAYPNLGFTWEEKTMANFGVDAKLFDLVTVNLDVFSEKRTQILESAGADVPAYTGFRLANQNTGEVKNSGVELSLRLDNNKNDFKYFVQGTFAYAHNEITKRSEIVQPHEWLYLQGYSINTARGLVFDGFYEEPDFDANGNLNSGVVASSYTNVRPGDMKYVDQNEDGIITDYDKIPMDYNAIPEITGAIKGGFTYKGLDFNVFVMGVTNRTVALPYNYTHPFVQNNNITAFSANPWTPATAATATSPRLTTQDNINNNQATDFYMRDGSYIKLRNIELGYTFGLGKIEAVRLSVTGTNLFTWDKIDDLEAESLSTGYPLSKAVSLGLKVNF